MPVIREDDKKSEVENYNSASFLPCLPAGGFPAVAQFISFDTTSY